MIWIVVCGGLWYLDPPLTDISGAMNIKNSLQNEYLGAMV